MLFFLIFMLMRLIAWCGLYDVFFFCSGESSQLTSLSIYKAPLSLYKASLSIEMKLKHYYAAYTPVRVICWIVLKKKRNYVRCGFIRRAAYLLENTVGTLITKKFGRKNNSDKRVSENLTVRNFRRPKIFTSEIFPELFHRENENNVYFALTIWRFFTTKSIFLMNSIDEIWTWLFQQLIIFPILCVLGPHFHIFCPNFAGFRI